MTSEELKALHESVVSQIFTLGYFVKLYNWALENHKPTLDVNNPESICAFWNDFWFLLPDDKSIRTAPFFEICALAEGEYLEESDSSDANVA